MTVELTEPTIKAEVYLSGSYESIKSVLSVYVLKGLCVSLDKVEYIYTYGIESGVRVNLINYPRFPSTQDEIKQEAISLGKKVLGATGQGSFTVVMDKETYFFSVRPQDE